MTTKHDLGQYFTTHTVLKQKVFEFILNSPTCILEPSIGQGDLIQYIADRIPGITFDMYEIDPAIPLLDGIRKDQVIYGDFMQQTIAKTYRTIIGNPPYVRTKKGNLYIDFIEKCYRVLADGGELIFIVPSDFLKLTSASKLLNEMMTNGTFTHIFHPNNERMFENASVDVILFRYHKHIASSSLRTVLYNGKPLHIINSEGLITFREEEEPGGDSGVLFQEYFDIYVGLVSGKEDVYKHDVLGNIEVLNAENKIDRYIYIEKYPCENAQINAYLLLHKNALMERRIRKFNENNWFEWGAPRNIAAINSNLGRDCIYICTLTRTPNVAFLGKVRYFGGGLIMLIPKKMCDLEKIVAYINSNPFKRNFMFSGRFKIGHRQISNSHIPGGIL
jgi:adenine-specific DNA-methyltransferase